MFTRRARAAVAAAFLAAAGLLGAATPAAGSHEGFCTNNEWPPTAETGQWFFERYAVADYDDLYGWVTDRALFPCEGSNGGGWSFTAAVNLQADGRPSNFVFQLGIIQFGGDAGEQNYFVKAKNDGSGDLVVLNGIRPSFGQRYMFRIYKGSSDGKIHYQIKDLAGNVLYATNTNVTWPADFDHGWWGWETQNSKSMPGHHGVDPAADLVGLYSVVGSGAINSVNSLSHLSRCPGTGDCGDYWPNTFMYTTGGANEIFNVET